MRSSAAVIALESTRQHPRIEVNLAAELIDMEEKRPALLGNIAKGGVFVATAKPAEIGSTVTVRFRLVSTLMCEASGRVVWRSTENKAGFGVAFDSVNKQMDSFTNGLAKVPVALRNFYLADVIDPCVEVEG